MLQETAFAEEYHAHRPSLPSCSLHCMNYARVVLSRIALHLAEAHFQEHLKLSSAVFLVAASHVKVC